MSNLKDMKGIPPHMAKSLIRYVNQGIPTGGFLEQVLSNNLVEAVGKADSENRKCIEAYANILYWELPSACWGSKEKVEKWIEKGGWENINIRRDTIHREKT
jgi:hypothetical protein